MRARIASIATALGRRGLGRHVHERVRVWCSSLDMGCPWVIGLVRAACVVVRHHGDRYLPVAGFWRDLVRLGLPLHWPLNYILIFTILVLFLVLEQIL